MKKINLLILFCAVTGMSFAQLKVAHTGKVGINIGTSQQNKLIREGKLWSNTTIGTLPNSEFQSYWVKFQGDTLINNLLYKKVMRSDDSLHSNWFVKRFIREDVASQKVYLYDVTSQLEMLLYDFSLETGDSILTGDRVSYAKVDTVIYEPFGNSTDTLKQVYFESGGIWVEGIGSLWGVLEGLNAFFTTGASTRLVCYYENNNLLYHNPEFDSCFPDSNTVSNSMFDSKKDIEIFPNPASDKITIHSPNSRIFEVEIYDLTGTCLYRNLNPGLNRLDLKTDNLPKGMNVLKVRDEQDKSSHKIIIQ